MSETFLDECISLLQRTPVILDNQLRKLPESFITANEGPETWCPFDVVGHLIHGDKTDWLPRMETILKYGENVPFIPFDRFAQARDSQDKTLDQLLDEFTTLRKLNIDRFKQLNITTEQLALTGTHPAFGSVTLKQLIATWVAHDLDHLNQINRVMACRYKETVGPWVQYLSILRERRSS
jgi:hypothetical protein